MDNSANPEQPAGPSAFGLDPGLEACGLNVAGVLPRETYDAIVPEAWRVDRLLPAAASVYVIGSGGSRFYFEARKAYPHSVHPLDEACEVHMTSAARTLDARGFESRALHYWERRGEGEGAFADFVALARAAGLGVASRIGLLLHPHFGPWFAIRALLMTARPFPSPYKSTLPIDFCADCPAPCAEACPANAIGSNQIDMRRCGESRQHDERCALRCAARLACPAGAESVYPDEALAHHMSAPLRDT